MDASRFWNLIADVAKGEPPCVIRAERLIDRLSGFSKAGIKGFERELLYRLKESYTWDLWALAYALRGGCSDDEFEYFRCWLILQGKDVFYKVTRNPDAAWRWLQLTETPKCEELLDVAYQSMLKRNGDPDNLPTLNFRFEPKGVPFDIKKIAERFPPDLRAKTTFPSEKFVE